MYYTHMRTLPGPLAAAIPAIVVVGFLPLIVRLRAMKALDLVTLLCCAPAVVIFVAALVRPAAGLRVCAKTCRSAVAASPLLSIAALWSTHQIPLEDQVAAGPEDPQELARLLSEIRTYHLVILPLMLLTVVVQILAHRQPVTNQRPE